MAHLYFAYGSNLDTAQMSTRCPSSTPVGPALLAGHRLMFCGFSRRWGGAVATIIQDHHAVVPGVLYALDDDDLLALDGFEGHPRDYVRVQHSVDGEQGPQPAWVYVKAWREQRWQSSEAYLHVLRRAYARWGFEARHLEEAVARCL